MECQEATTMKSRQHDTLTWQREPTEPQLQAIRNAGVEETVFPREEPSDWLSNTSNIRCAEQVHVYI